jgi:hypothetical protein
MEDAPCCLTPEEIARAKEIFERECRHQVPRGKGIIINVQTGEYIIDDFDFDGGVTLYKKFVKRFGERSRGMLFHYGKPVNELIRGVTSG